MLVVLSTFLTQLWVPTRADAAGQSRLTKSIYAGGASGARLSSDGTILTWGDGAVGVLGNGTNTNPQLTPVRVELAAGVPLDRVTSIAGGYRHMCALRSDSTVWCWGDNGEGRLGDGTTTGRNRPVRVETSAGVPLIDVVQIRAGFDYTSALLADGTVWSWGRNTDGQLGIGNLTNQSRPVQATVLSDGSPLTEVISIGGGRVHATAVRADGTVWAWGANAVGQLGDGTTVRRTAAVQAQSGAGPLTDIVEVASMGDHSLALRSDGVVWTWGDNGYGQLADGTTVSRSTAVQATTASGTAVRARSIFGGQYNSYWVQQDGTVYAVGYGGWNSNGDGTTTSRSRGVQVLDTSGSAISSVTSLSGLHGAVALKSDGSIWSWGYNPDGRSGTGATGDVPRATQISPTRGSEWTDTAAGASHTVGLRANGTVWAWGTNVSGQLGIGAAGAGVDGPPLQVTIAGGAALSNVIEIAAGSNHTLALRADGSVWAWGAGSVGQLGDGTSTNGTRAVQVTTAEATPVVGARAIAAGGESSYAVLADGTVLAWGAGTGGQLGSNALADVPRAGVVQQAGGTPLPLVWDVAGGGIGAAGSALFLRSDGSVWAAGDNAAGQLGDATTTRRLQAVQARSASGDPLGSIAEISAGSSFSLARTARGLALAWGANDSGQLASGSLTSRLSPDLVLDQNGASLANVRSIEAGAGHGVAVVSSGSLYAWGSGAEGQLGNGSTDLQTTAVAAVTATGASVAVIRASAGAQHTSALSTPPGGGTGFAIMSTGQDASGQLGDCGRGGTSIALVPLATTCPSPVNDGVAADVDGQASTSQIVANWDGHVDQTLLRYDYCMATAVDATGCVGTVLVPWTSNGTATSVTRTALALTVDVTYFTCVRLARSDASMLAPVCSDGVKVDNTPPALPTLISPADGAAISIPDLTASYVDSSTSGRIEVQVCSDAPCSMVVTTALSPIVASGSNGTARPVVARGTWFWRARATDAAGQSSDWTATRTFSYNAIPVATAMSPVNGAWVSTRQPGLVVRHQDADGGAGTITAELCSTAPADPWSSTCGPTYQTAVTGSGAVANGATATLSPNVPLTDGSWSWRARSADDLAATSPWTSIRTIRVDATPPAPVPTVTLIRKGVGKIDVTWTASTDGGIGGVRYEVQRYQTGTSSWTPMCTTTALTCREAGLGGAEILVVRVRSCDSLGNCTQWSGASAVSNSGYLLRNTAAAHLGNTQSRVATLPPAGVLDNTSTGVRLPSGGFAGRIGQFPLRYGVAANTAKIAMDTTAPIDPQDTVSGWGWVIDDVEGKAISAGQMEAVVTTEAIAGTGTGTGRVICRIWRAQTNGTNALQTWQHLADATGSATDVMTASTAGPTTSTCDLSAALSSQLTFATNEVLYLELLIDATVDGAAGDQYMLRFNDASTAINMPKPGTPPSVPTPVAPISAVITGDAPVLTATYNHPAGADGTLEMQVSTDSTFATGVTTVATPPVTAGGTATFGIGPLALGQTWYWRARGRDSAGLTSLWTANQSFRTSVAPAAPVPSSPANAASMEAGTVALVGSAFSDADLPSDSHAVSQWQVAPAGSDWSVTAADSGAIATALTSWTTPALGAGSWQWRVRYRDQYGIWSAWSSVSNPRTFTMTESSISISLSTPTVALGLLTPGADALGSFTIAAGTTTSLGYALSATDGSDTSLLTCACGGSLEDWTGTDVAPTLWSGGTAGYAGLTVRDAPGGRLAKWGAGTATMQGDLVENRYAGPRQTSSLLLHSTSAAGSGEVVVTVRANPLSTTTPGDYAGTVVISIAANP